MRRQLFLIIALLCAVAQGAWADLEVTEDSKFSGGTGTSTDPYKISSVDDWNQLATDVVDKKNTYYRKYFKLTADLGTAENPVTTMIGYDYHYFEGSFDGNGHTITVNLSSDEDDCAPFREYGDGTIKNLRMAGTITTSARHAGSVVGSASGNPTLKNVHSSVTINSTKSGDAYHGGLVGYAASINIEGCSFTGSLLGPDSRKCGGIVGEKPSAEGNTHVQLKNCVFAPASVTFDETNSYNFVVGSTTTYYSYTSRLTITNCYYFQAFGTAQGKQARTITNGDDFVTTLENAGTATTYSVSGITSYGTGIQYGGMLYGGKDDQISLTLEHGANGDKTFYGYSAGGSTISGNASPYTLTMIDRDVRISTLWQGDFTPVSTESELRAAIADGANIYLMNDITVASHVTIPASSTVTVNLNGYVLRGNSTASAGTDGNYSCIFVVAATAGLTLNNGTLADANNSATSNTDHSGGAIVNKGTLTLTYVTISGCQGIYGGAIRNNEGATLTIGTGTVISGNSATATGGAISNKGTLNFQDGIISGNQALFGGGIFNEGGATLNMTGGTLSGNTSTIKYGEDSNAVVDAICESITNIFNTHNDSEDSEDVGGGGGICNFGTANISGGTISGNTANHQGGGIWNGVNSSAGILTITGGTIQSNSCANKGGGVYFYDGTLNMNGTPIIDSNDGSNLYLPSDKTITVTGQFTQDANIGISLDNYDRTFTTGYNDNNTLRPSLCFFADADGLEVSEYSNEVKLIVTASGTTAIYVERSWKGGDTDGHVVSTQKFASSVHTYNGEEELNGGTWLFSGQHEYSDRITISASTKIILEDGCDITLKNGIYIQDGKTLDIYGQTKDNGKLQCTGAGGHANNGDAAIGGNNEKMGGYLHIHGGVIYAKPSHNCAAGIGGGDDSYDDADVGFDYWTISVDRKDNDHGGMRGITIYGGKVTAVGQKHGAGIGPGWGNYNCPTIRIYGGDILAQGGEEGAGIGVGCDDRYKNGDIHIYGGNIVTTGGKNGAGIGGGGDGNMLGGINIYGGTVNAQGGDNASGIGSGAGCEMHHNIHIYGGKIYAKGGKNGAGIGAGYEGKIQDVAITVNGGEVYATGSKGAPGIGHGADDATAKSKHRSCPFDMRGGYVEAKTIGGGAACIGGGKYTQGLMAANFYDGTVKCIYTNEEKSDNGFMFVGCGAKYSEDSYYNGKYSIANTLMVSTNGTKAHRDGREDALKAQPDGYSVLTIEPCDHQGSNYTQKNQDQHSLKCSYCQGYDENHTLDANGRCTVCGYERNENPVTITFYEGKADGSGYNETGTEYQMVVGQTFTVPTYTSLPEGKVFVGWKQASSTPGSINIDNLAEPSELTRPDAQFTVTSSMNGRKYYARYQNGQSGLEGTGSASDPYLIKTPADLQLLSENIRGGIEYSGQYFRLANDIEYDITVENNFTPIGDTETLFCGTFDGAGHSISGININRPEDNYQALFVKTWTDGVIKNLTLNNSTITANGYSAGILAYNWGTVQNCHVTNTVTITQATEGAKECVSGGIVSYSAGTVSGCTSAVNITTHERKYGFAGGVVGLGYNTEYCLYLGDGGLPSSTNTFDDPDYDKNKDTYYSGAIDVTNAGGALTSCFYLPQSNGVQGEAATFYGGTAEAYTIKSGNVGLKLDYADMEANYDYNGVKAYASGLLFGDTFYTGATHEVTFTPTVTDGKYYTGYNALAADESATPATDNGNGSFTLAMNGKNVIIVPAEAANYPQLDFADAPGEETNAAKIATYDGQTVHAAITERTLKKDGYWQPLCLPFDVSEEQIDVHPLFSGCNIMELDTRGWYDADGNCYSEAAEGFHRTGYDTESGKLYLYLKRVSEIEAGHPYLVSWASGDAITPPRFPASVIEDYSLEAAVSADGVVAFIGNYDPVAITGADLSKLCLGDDDQIGCPSGATAVNAFRAYFQLHGIDLKADNLSNTLTTVTTDGIITGVTAVFDADLKADDLTLEADDDNAELISQYAGALANVTLSGTTLKCDGTVQTICLPFSLDALEGSPLEGFTVKSPLSGEVATTDASKFLVHSSDVTTITAHHPYIIQWTADAADDIVNPTFNRVYITAGSPEEVKLGNNDEVSICGSYAPKSITAAGNDYYVTAGGQVDNTSAYSLPAQQVFIHNDGSFTEIRLEGATPVWDGSGTDDAPYLIQNATDFAALSIFVNNGNTYKGKHFRMTADVGTALEPVTMMVGDYGTNAFMGTFDGDGHTLTVSYINPEEERTAPFRRISGATIKNLHVAGTIETSIRYAGGIVGYSRYTSKIQNCRSSVVIRSSHAGFSGHGGIMALKANVGSSTPTIEGCVFDGKILSTGEEASSWCGAIVGYTNGQTLTIKDCLYTPAALADGETYADGSTLYNNSTSSQPKTTVTCTNCYYTVALGTEQGTQAIAYDTAPSQLGSKQTEYGFLTAYANGIFTDGKYYTAATNTTFVDNDVNDVARADGRFGNVTIAGRKLFKDGDWNTLCLPFDVTIDGSALDGATVMELDTDGSYDADGTAVVPDASASGLSSGLHQTGFDSETGTLYLYFKTATEIEAGKPYLIKWENTAGTELNSPVFTAVTIESASPEAIESQDGTVTFVGNFDPVSISGNTYLYLSTANSLYYPSTARTINAFRAYFQLDGITAGEPTSSEPNTVRAFVQSFAEEDTTGIVEITDTTPEPSPTWEGRAAEWYSIDGRKLAKKPTAKGIYIFKAMKRVIK